MHLAKSIGSGAALAVALGLLGASAQAETFNMTCKNSRYSYRVSFDDDAKRFRWASDSGQVDYIVVRVKADEEGLTVWGKVRRYGNDFIAYFAPDGWMKNFYANGSSMSDICHGSH